MQAACSHVGDSLGILQIVRLLAIVYRSACKTQADSASVKLAWQLTCCFAWGILYRPLAATVTQLSARNCFRAKCGCATPTLC